MKNQQFLELKKMLGEVLEEVDSRLEFHDFRMIDGRERINLIFDLVVPRDYQRSQYQMVKEQIIRRVRERDGRCQCIITMENSYCAETVR
ncbi:MAG: cation-efflux pump, partial [Lachnospiraceae bacterium]|nr:cation-efflux pump [Lachnospiraceae bacterium]